MIVIYHNGKNVIEIANAASVLSINKFINKSIAHTLVEVAKQYPDEIVMWCHRGLKEQLNILEIKKIFHHKKILLSYSPSNTPFWDKSIGYVDTSFFARINSEVTFATWQISSSVGGIHSEVLLALKDKICFDKDLDYFLCSLAKLAMPNGLLCYSEPKLLKQKQEVTSKSANIFTLFRFVKQHYKFQWIFLLLFNMMVYERKFPILPFLFSLLYKNRNKVNIDLDGVKVQSSRNVIDKAMVDVIIPTIGRKS
jgi:hypothetical protein